MSPEPSFVVVQLMCLYSVFKLAGPWEIRERNSSNVSFGVWEPRVPLLLKLFLGSVVYQPNDLALFINCKQWSTGLCHVANRRNVLIIQRTLVCFYGEGMLNH